MSGSFYQRPKARLLRRFRQVHPELQDQRAVIGECALEAGDALELLVEVGAVAAAVDTIEHRARIPRAQEQGDAAVSGQVPPVAPVLRPFGLFIRWLRVGACLDPARVHPAVQQVDRLALSRAVDAGKDDDHRETRTNELLLDVEQFGAQDRNACLVFLFRNRSIELGCLEHDSPVSDRRVPVREDEPRRSAARSTSYCSTPVGGTEGATVVDCPQGSPVLRHESRLRWPDRAARASSAARRSGRPGRASPQSDGAQPR